MASVVSICNLALANIAKPEIQDINEPTAEAQACKKFYEQARDTLLQSYPWRFATETVALAQITNPQTDRWQYAYKRPTNCLRPIRILDELGLDYLPGEDSLVVAGGLIYAIEGSVLFCHTAPAWLRQVSRITDPTLFPPLFVEALSWHLAVKLSMPLTRDPKVRADAYQLSVQTGSQAAVADANEVREVENAPSRAIEAR